MIIQKRNYVSLYIKHFNWDAAPSLNIGKFY